VLGQSEIGLAEIVLYIVPAPGADGSAAVAAARERLSRHRGLCHKAGSGRYRRPSPQARRKPRPAEIQSRS
jgi:hypothetical protein